jgi:hypothetical protein
MYPPEKPIRPKPSPSTDDTKQRRPSRGRKRKLGPQTHVRRRLAGATPRRGPEGLEPVPLARGATARHALFSALAARSPGAPRGRDSANSAGGLRGAAGRRGAGATIPGEVAAPRWPGPHTWPPRTIRASPTELAWMEVVAGHTRMQGAEPGRMVMWRTGQELRWHLKLARGAAAVRVLAFSLLRKDATMGLFSIFKRKLSRRRSQRATATVPAHSPHSALGRPRGHGHRKQSERLDLLGVR